MRHVMKRDENDGALVVTTAGSAVIVQSLIGTGQIVDAYQLSEVGARTLISGLEAAIAEVEKTREERREEYAKRGFSVVSPGEDAE